MSQNEIVCISDAVTLGAIPQADTGPDDDAGKPTGVPDPAADMTKKIAEMQLTDDADSVPMIPSTHEKADMLLAYSTVPGMCFVLY